MKCLDYAPDLSKAKYLRLAKGNQNFWCEQKTVSYAVIDNIVAYRNVQLYICHVN